MIQDEPPMEEWGLPPTEHDQPGVGVGGAQRVLRRAAIHRAVQFGRHAFQHQLFPVMFGAAVQEPAPDTGPGEHGLGEDFVLEPRIPPTPTPNGQFNQQHGGKQVVWLLP